MFFSNLFISRVYARSIFSLAIDQDNIGLWKLMLELFSQVSSHSLLRPLFFQYLNPERLSDIFIAICTDIYGKSLGIFAEKFIHILAQNNRLLLLPVILKEFINLCDMRESVIKVKIVSARFLYPDQMKKIVDMLSQNLSGTISFKHEIDKSILSGIMIYVGDTVIDSSIRGRISRLGHLLKF